MWSMTFWKDCETFQMPNRTPKNKKKLKGVIVVFEYVQGQQNSDDTP